MAYVIHEINALISIDPTKAKKTILAALKKAKMHKEDAAKLLGCNYVTLLRWISRLDMEAEIEEANTLAKKQGKFHDRKGGRPLGTTVANGAARPQRTKVRAKKKSAKPKRRRVKAS